MPQQQDLWLNVGPTPNRQGILRLDGPMLGPDDDALMLEAMREHVLKLSPEQRATLPPQLQQLAQVATPKVGSMIGNALFPPAATMPTFRALSAPAGDQAPPDPRALELIGSLTQPTLGEQAAGMALRTVPAVAGGALFGPPGAVAGGALGEAAAEYLVEGRDVNPWQVGVSGALNLLPGAAATGGMTRLGLSGAETMGESALANSTIGGILRAAGTGALQAPVSTVGTNWAEGRPLTDGMAQNVLLGGAFGAATHGAIEGARAAAPAVTDAARQVGGTVRDIIDANPDLARLVTDETGAAGKVSQAKSRQRYEHLELAPVSRDQGQLVVSNRVPSGVDARPGVEGQPLSTGLAQVLESPGLTEKMAETVRTFPIITSQQSRLSPRGVLEAGVETMQQNLQFLLDKMAPFAERSRLWYDGAHAIARHIAGHSQDYTVDQTSGVIAVLSPQKDWHQNAAMAGHVVDTVRDATRHDLTFSQEIWNQYVGTSQSAHKRKLDKGIKDGKLTADQARVLMSEFATSLDAERRAYLDVPWSKLTAKGRARFVRAYSELKNGQSYPILAPEGSIAQIVARNRQTAGQLAKGVDGKPSKLGWQSYPMIMKALSILEDGSDENISRQLGSEHKVRAFFNNINAPWSPLASTVDTHQVAGSHISPFAQSSPAVKYSMGGTSNAATGVSGSNPLYQEALARQSAVNDLLPRELQSITWEGLKGMFSPEQKRNKALEKTIKSIWMDYRRGRRSLGDTHEAIIDAAGGIAPPSWATASR